MYTPNNTTVYLAAISGAASGLGAQQQPIVSPDYIAIMADAYAQEFDTVWGVTLPTELDLDTIEEVSEGVWENRAPLPTSIVGFTGALIAISATPGSYNGIVNEAIALVRATTARAVAQGINPNPSPVSGVANVTATAPMTSTGGANPNIAINAVGAVQSAVPVSSALGGPFVIRQLTQDDIAAGFAISSFTGGSTVETGATVTNPAFTAAYNATPSSAQIANTDGIDSPLALVAPYTAGTVVGAFTHATPTTVTFTLTAVGSATKTATQAINFFDRTFGGVGTAGAVSATASGNTAVLNGGLGTLNSEGLFSSIVGQTFPTLNPSSQKIYILTQHTASAHTFQDTGTGFAFPMNAPTTFAFVNQNGASLSYDIYESTNVLSSAFTLKVLT